MKTRTEWARPNRGEPAHLGARALGTVLLLAAGLACSDDPTAPRGEAWMGKQAGDEQVGQIGVPLEPLIVRVADRGKPVRGATVRWEVTLGSGSVTPASTATDENGLALAVLTPGEGGNRVAARLADAGLVVVFTALACAQLCVEWGVAPPLPQGRAWAARAVVDGRIWVLGGVVDDAGSVAGDVLVHDTETGGWHGAAPLPSPRAGGLAAAIDDEVLYIGGASSGAFETPVASVLVFDTSRGAWTEGTPMEHPRFHAAGAAIEGKVYVAGGMSRCWFLDGCDPPLSDLEIYDPVTDRWTDGAPMPGARAGAGAAVLDGKLYVAGGTDCPPEWGLLAGLSCNHLTDVQEYDPATDTWTTRTPLPVAGPTRLAVLDGRLYALLQADESSSRIYEYDRSGDSWWRLGEIEPRRLGPALVGLGDRLYVIGGDGGWTDDGLALYETVLTMKR